MAYYYLAASLPMLSIETAPPMPVPAYVELCREHLTASEMKALVQLDHDEPSDHPIAKAWQQRETQLRNAVVRQRAQKTHVDASTFTREHTGYSVQIDNAVESAFQSANALQRESMLDQLRWTLLDDLQGTDQFGTATIMTYLLRLKLCSRWSALTEENGKARMDRTLSAAKGEHDTEEQTRS